MFTTARKKLAQRTRRLIAPIVRRFVRQQDGAAAIEFGLVAAPFLALTFAIMETAIVFFAGQALETATADSARLIMTGQAQTQGMSQSQFKDAVCSRIFGLFDCSKVQVDVRKYSGFDGAQLSKPIKDGQMDGSFTPAWQPGGAGCINVVRLLYEYPVYVTLLGLNLADLAPAPGKGGRRLLVATAAFRNEPFGAGGASC